MTEVGIFTELKNKMVPLLPWELWPSESEVQKNDSLGLIIEILYLKEKFLKRIAVCCRQLLLLATCKNCFKIDLDL